MRSLIKKFSFLLAAVSFASTSALAQTATFDDLVNFQPVPPGYVLPGSIWYNWYVADQAFLSGYPYNKEECAVSEPNCAYNGGGFAAGISRASPFDFTGGYFMAWADNSCPDIFACAITLTVTGYNSATIVGSNTVSLDPFATQWFAFNFSNVDNVTFETQLSNGGAQAWYLADNLVFNENFAAVPEPASIILLATGLVGVLGAARRRWRKGSSRELNA